MNGLGEGRQSAQGNGYEEGSSGGGSLSILAAGWLADCYWPFACHPPAMGMPFCPLLPPPTPSPHTPYYTHWPAGRKTRRQTHSSSPPSTHPVPPISQQLVVACCQQPPLMAIDGVWGRAPFGPSRNQPPPPIQAFKAVRRLIA